MFKVLLFGELLGTLAGASEGIFRNPSCHDYLVAIYQAGPIELRFPTELPLGALRQEFHARQTRLSWLREENQRRIIQHQNLIRVLGRYGTLVAKEWDDTQILWRQALDEVGREQVPESHDFAWSMEAVLELPAFLKFQRPPLLEQYATLRRLSLGLAMLSAFRVEVSEELVNLPLNKPLSQHPPELLQDAFYSVIARWNDGSACRDCPLFTFREQIAVLNSDYDVTVLKEMLLADARLPPALAREIQWHEDFLQKYQLPTDSLFNGLLTRIENYISQGNR